MNEQKKTRKFIITMVIISIAMGLLFSLLFAWFTGDPFKQVVVIGFWFGPVMGIILTIMKFTRGKFVEETFTYDGDEDYLRRVKSILERLKYKIQDESDSKTVWSYDGGEMDLLLSDKVTVQVKDTSLIISGPIVVIRKLKEFINK